MKLKNHQEINVVVTAVSPVGAEVHAAGAKGFVDHVKHPAWRSHDVPPPKVGDRLHVVVLDETRAPVRLSALASDIDIARALRSQY
ncbi:hypothetical protein ACFYVL_40925 [Streptomyces sp. NPDC004111]|uniref:hypothetical protein n=1 Tax=Streptomyces sp. NPDC004111 TaxID=3364690 RepID=UPI0036D0EBD9